MLLKHEADMLSPFTLILLIDNIMRCEMKKMRLRNVLVSIAVMLNFTVAAVSSMIKLFIDYHNRLVLAGEPLPSGTMLFQTSAHWYWLFALLCLIVFVSPHYRKYFYLRLCVAFAAPMLWLLLILVTIILVNFFVCGVTELG